MKKIRKQNFIVKWGLYPFDVMISFGEEHREVVRRVEKLGYKLTDEEKEKLWMEGNGRTMILESNQTIIRLDTDDPALIVHEVFHAVSFLMEKLGAKLIIGVDDECYSYAIQFLSNEIFKRRFTEPTKINLSH